MMRVHVHASQTCKNRTNFMPKDYTIPDRIFPIIQEVYDRCREKGDCEMSSAAKALRFAAGRSWQIKFLSRIKPERASPAVLHEQDRLLEFVLDMTQGKRPKP